MIGGISFRYLLHQVVLIKVDFLVSSVKLMLTGPTCRARAIALVPKILAGVATQR